MDASFAKKLNQLFLAHAERKQNRISGRWPVEKKTLSGFHQWADGRPALGAFLLSSQQRDPLWFALVDWKKSDNFYLVLFPESRNGPLAEIHQMVDASDGHSLVWNYKPSIRDGKNDQRRAYFEHAVGSRDVYLHFPNMLDEVEDFIDDAAYLVECRIKADKLAQDLPKPRDGFPEGRLVERLHTIRERNPTLVKLAKDAALQKHGNLRCACCGFDFKKTYGELGHGFIEAHHTKPLSSLEADGAATALEDLALVCSNCHRMLHRRRPWLGPDQLKRLLSNG